MKLARTILAFATVLALPALASAAPQAASVSYTVTVDAPWTHIFRVRMEVADVTAPQLDLSMPVWTPGSYLIREYERHVVRFAPADRDGHPLAWRKLDKNSWRIAAGGADRLIVEYEVYAREPGIRWSFLYDEGGHILGPNLFFFVVGRTAHPVTATFQLPPGWQLAGGLQAAGDGPFIIQAASYDQLIDTPMLIGHFDEISFEVEGVPHLIAILGPNNADLEQLAGDFARIVQACSQLFGGLPYQRYAFVFLTVASGGGIEHADGTTIGLGGIDFRSARGGRAVLGVTAHEFFHAWVVKRIQPPAFRPYNYEEENYTDALWFYEGFTSYYGERILQRAGLIDQLSDPVALVTSYRSTPGYYVQSAADASFNAWIQYYRRDESSSNYQTDYYFKGRLIANLLEIEIARRTGGARGLDDVMRWIWQRARDQGAAFESADIRAACEQVAGGSFAQFFDDYVFGAGDIPFESFFRLAGYDLVVDEAATRERDRSGYLGVRFGSAAGAPVIQDVVRGGPAWRDGLNYGDQVMTVDSVRVTTTAALLDRLEAYPPGTALEFGVWRLGERRTIRVTLGVPEFPIYELTEVDHPSEAQLAVRRIWRQGG